MSSEFDKEDNINNEIDPASVEPVTSEVVNETPSNEGDSFDSLSVIDISSDVEYQLNQERAGMEVVKLEANKSTRKLNSFDIFCVRVWAAIVSAITLVSSSISKGFFKLFKKELPERYVTSVISIILIILLIVLILSPFHLTMSNNSTTEIFSDSLIPVMGSNGKWGYVNKGGRPINPNNPFEFYNARPFYNKVAFVQTTPDKWQLIGTNGEVNKGFSVAVDRDGKQVVSDFNNPERCAWIIENNKYRFIKPNGTNAFGDVNFDYAESFSYGYALVRRGQTWSFYNGRGKQKSPNYTEAKSFNEGYAAVKKNTGWTFVDTKFKEIKPDMAFDAVTSFQNGYAWVRSGDGINLIDKNGNRVLEQNYNGLKPSDENLRELGLELKK